MDTHLQKIRPLTPRPRARCRFAGWRRLLPGLLLGLALLWFPGCTSGPRTTARLSGSELMKTGTEAFRRGDFGDAAAAFTSAGQWFEEQRKSSEQYEALVSAGQAYSFAGLHQKALDELEAALALAQKQKDQARTARALGAIGNCYLALGRLTLAEENLSRSAALARKAKTPRAAAAALNNLGNLCQARQHYQTALKKYREAESAAVKADDPLLQAQILVNQATAAARLGRSEKVAELLDRAVKRLDAGKDSTLKAYTLINAALLYDTLSRQQPDAAAELMLAAVKAYNKALAVTRDLDDQRTASYVYGNLATLYESSGQYRTARELTRQAVFAAQASNSPEALYRWNWQNGRLLTEQQKLAEAICAYRLAISELQSIRDEFSAAYVAVPCATATYRATARKISSEFVDLLLKQASRQPPGEKLQALLAEARDALEILKVYELREYFKDDCLDAAREARKKIDLVSKQAVIIYPVLLPDRVELLVSFSGRLKRYPLPVGTAELGREALLFRKTLMKRTSWEFLPHAQKLYGWLIRPLEKELERLPGATLVFVPDGALRSIPMAALHDGKKFLITNHPIAITPSLTLTDPQPLKPAHARLLALGLTEPVQGFPGLPYVADELKEIRKIYPGETLLNDRFSSTSLAAALKQQPYNILHIASHGHFGNQLDDTFLLAFDEKLTMDCISRDIGLYRFRQEPLDLITLSACETAVGDDRAALGLAGVAVRAGARSALATLWQVNDPVSCRLVAEFYRQLNTPGCSRATALQRAQLKLLQDSQYEHPCYWAPFLLINNWL